MLSSRPQIRSVVARAVNVVLKRPLQTGGGTIGSVPLCLVDVESTSGERGSAYIFCYTPLAAGPIAAMTRNMGTLIENDPLAPADINEKLARKFLLIGRHGIVAMALAGIDMALWDAFAKEHGKPLVELLGGSRQPIQAYNSCGLGLIGAEKAAAEAIELLQGGFSAVKLRLGYPTCTEDVAVARKVRRALPDQVIVMTDYNQCLNVTEARARGKALTEEGIYWLEEPVLAEDYANAASLAQELSVPIQIGENFWGIPDMTKALAAKACDFVMPDAVKIGGVSGWMAASALANAHGIPMSSHLFPEVSAHLLAVTPMRHWLEYVDWADPILAEPVTVRDGAVTASERPGNGIIWNEAAVERFAIS